MFYNARYYDAGIGRFVSADSIVPGNASGGMAGVAYKPLTVDFHEPGFVSVIAGENQFGPWYMLSEKQRQQLGSPWGPSNPQALNRYAYVGNNPIRNIDPEGHEAVCKNDYSACTGARVVNNSSHSILVKGDMVLADGTVLKDQIFRLGPGESSISLGIIDVDEIYVDTVAIDGYGPGYGTKLDDGTTVIVTNDGHGELTIGRRDLLQGVLSKWYKYPHSGNVADLVLTDRGVDISKTRQITGPEVYWARLAASQGWDNYRDCTQQGQCTLPK